MRRSPARNQLRGGAKGRWAPSPTRSDAKKSPRATPGPVRALEVSMARDDDVLFPMSPMVPMSALAKKADGQGTTVEPSPICVSPRIRRTMSSPTPVEGTKKGRVSWSDQAHVPVAGEGQPGQQDGDGKGSNEVPSSPLPNGAERDLAASPTPADLSGDRNEEPKTDVKVPDNAAPTAQVTATAATTQATTQATPSRLEDQSLEISFGEASLRIKVPASLGWAASGDLCLSVPRSVVQRAAQGTPFTAAIAALAPIHPECSTLAPTPAMHGSRSFGMGGDLMETPASAGLWTPADPSPGTAGPSLAPNALAAGTETSGSFSFVSATLCVASPSLMANTPWVCGTPGPLVGATPETGFKAPGQYPHFGGKVRPAQAGAATTPAQAATAAEAATPGGQGASHRNDGQTEDARTPHDASAFSFPSQLSPVVATLPAGWTRPPAAATPAARCQRAAGDGLSSRTTEGARGDGEGAGACPSADARACVDGLSGARVVADVDAAHAEGDGDLSVVIPRALFNQLSGAGVVVTVPADAVEGALKEAAGTGKDEACRGMSEEGGEAGAEVDGGCAGAEEGIDAAGQGLTDQDGEEGVVVGRAVGGRAMYDAAVVARLRAVARKYKAAAQQAAARVRRLEAKCLRLAAKNRAVNAEAGTGKGKGGVSGAEGVACPTPVRLTLRVEEVAAQAKTPVRVALNVLPRVPAADCATQVTPLRGATEAAAQTAAEEQAPGVEEAALMTPAVSRKRARPLPTPASAASFGPVARAGRASRGTRSMAAVAEEQAARADDARGRSRQAGNGASDSNACGEGAGASGVGGTGKGVGRKRAREVTEAGVEGSCRSAGARGSKRARAESTRESGWRRAECEEAPGPGVASPVASGMSLRSGKSCAAHHASAAGCVEGGSRATSRASRGASHSTAAGEGGPTRRSTRSRR